MFISKEFAERFVRFVNPEYLRVYIYARTAFENGDGVIGIPKLAEKLQTDEKNIRWAIEYWDACAAVKFNRDKDKYEFLDIDGVLTGEKTKAEAVKKPLSHSKLHSKSHLLSRPSYTPVEIDTAARLNPELDYLFKKAEEILCRTLSQTDVEMLYSFVDWLGLPVEVVVMLLTYVTSIGNGTRKYIESVAIDWSNKEINTYEKAEELVQKLEALDTIERKLRRILGIYDRALTATEKKYFKNWTSNFDFDDEMYEIAYDRTIEGTGKLSYAYMNKILESWHNEGIKTVDMLKRSDELYKMINANKEENSKIKKSKFNNYTDTSEIDYSKMAEKALDDMLDYDFGE